MKEPYEKRVPELRVSDESPQRAATGKRNFRRRSGHDARRDPILLLTMAVLLSTRRWRRRRRHRRVARIAEITDAAPTQGWILNIHPHARMTACVSAVRNLGFLYAVDINLDRAADNRGSKCVSGLDAIRYSVQAQQRGEIAEWAVPPNDVNVRAVVIPVRHIDFVQFCAMCRQTRS